MVAPATPTLAPSPAPLTPAAPSSIPATPVPREPEFGEVLWSSDVFSLATPVAGATQLTSDVPRIVANVPAYALPAGSQVSAAWSYNSTSLDAFATTLTIEQSQDEQWLTFQLSRNTEEPWPVGIYEITISLNGQVAQSASVEVIP
jgi:hypothetical protein